MTDKISAIEAILGDTMKNAEDAARPILLSRGEQVTDEPIVSAALEEMLIVGMYLRNSSGLLIQVPVSAALARKHLVAMLEEALDGANPLRKDPGTVVVGGFGLSSAK